MSTIFQVAFIGVAIVILAVLLDAVIAVSRTPKWGLPKAKLLIVSTTKRRTLDLPFVGMDRRRDATDSTVQQQDAA